MQNLASESEHIFPNCIVIPQCDHGLTLVTPSFDSGVTKSTPAQTTDIPPTHTGLSRKQAQVLGVLIKNLTRITNYASISAAVSISKSAARSAVNQLTKKKYISLPTTVRDGVFQGFSYWIDNEKCRHFMEAGGALNEKYFTPLNILTPPPHTVCSHSDPHHALSSSSSLEQKLTAKTVDLTDPELQWWADQGLASKQIISWLDQFRMKTEELAQSLRFARFDAVVNEIKPNGKPIENPQNWFYTILRRAGAYQRPKNYKSIYEIRANELEEQQRRDETARLKIWEAEIEDKFSELMNDQENPLFQELLDSVNDFAKDNPFAREIEMKELFKKKFAAVSNSLTTP